MTGRHRHHRHPPAAPPCRLQARRTRPRGDTRSGQLPALVAHELSHQWFYALVGNNQATDPWLDESLATWGRPSPAATATGSASIPRPTRGARPGHPSGRPARKQMIRGLRLTGRSRRGSDLGKMSQVVLLFGPDVNCADSSRSGRTEYRRAAPAGQCWPDDAGTTTPTPLDALPRTSVSR